MEDIGVPIAEKSAKFLDQLRLLIRQQQLAYATEKRRVSAMLSELQRVLAVS